MPGPPAYLSFLQHRCRRRLKTHKPFSYSPPSPAQGSCVAGTSLVPVSCAGDLRFLQKLAVLAIFRLLGGPLSGSHVHLSARWASHPGTPCVTGQLQGNKRRRGDPSPLINRDGWRWLAVRVRSRSGVAGLSSFHQRLAQGRHQLRHGAAVGQASAERCPSTIHLQVSTLSTNESDFINPWNGSHLQISIAHDAGHEAKDNHIVKCVRAGGHEAAPICSCTRGGTDCWPVGSGTPPIKWPHDLLAVPFCMIGGMVSYNVRQPNEFACSASIILFLFLVGLAGLVVWASWHGSAK